MFETSQIFMYSYNKSIWGKLKIYRKIIRLIRSDWRMKRMLKSGNLKTSHGSTHRNFNLSKSLDYINRVFNDYLKYASLSSRAFMGKKILEIGPGDNLGVALMFLANGASKVVTLDKFYSKRDSEKEKKIYQKLREGLDGKAKHSFDEAVPLDKNIKISPNRLKCIYGEGIENTENLFKPNFFDFIVSRAVLEEIYDLDSAFSNMDRILKPGGFLLHKIDLRDYKMFSGAGMHPLDFLTIPNFLYRLMTQHSGRPNRKLVNYYRKKMSELGYDAKIFITHILGVKEEILSLKENSNLDIDYSDFILSLVKEIRPRLQPEFKKMSDEELIISGIFLVAKKPV